MNKTNKDLVFERPDCPETLVKTLAKQLVQLWLSAGALLRGYFGWCGDGFKIFVLFVEMKACAASDFL